MGNLKSGTVKISIKAQLVQMDCFKENSKLYRKVKVPLNIRRYSEGIGMYFT